MPGLPGIRRRVVSVADMHTLPGRPHEPGSAIRTSMMLRLRSASVVWAVIFKKLAKRRQPRGRVEVGLLSEDVQLLLDVFESRLDHPSDLMTQELCA
jgi:hypothetical protein